MDKVTRCLHCGKRIGADTKFGRTHGVEVFVLRQLDPMEMTAANKWADSPLATPISETVPETVF